jgi:hypothetical protein
VEPDLESLRAQADFVPVAAALAKEIAAWVEEAAQLLPSPLGGWSDERQAILCALMVRVSKLLRRMARACQDGDLEATETWARCAFESIVNFHYLQPEETGSERLQRFKVSGYTPQRMILDHLEEKETSEGREGLEEWKLQAKAGLLDFMTTNGLLEAPGTGQFWKRLEAAGFDRKMETYLWALPSKAVHGTYPNLLEVHLEEVQEGAFAPDFGLGAVNPIVPMACIYLTLGMLDLYLLGLGDSVYPVWRSSLEELEARLQRIRERHIWVNEQEGPPDQA